MKNPPIRKIKASRADLADRLAALRVARGMTQQRLATAAKVDRKTINRIENEHFSPSIETLLRICCVLQTTPSKVLKGIDVSR